MLKGSFKVTGISLALDGAESSLFRNSEQLQHASRTEEYPHDSYDLFASDPHSLIAYLHVKYSGRFVLWMGDIRNNW